MPRTRRPKRGFYHAKFAGDKSTRANGTVKAFRLRRARLLKVTKASRKENRNA